MRVNIIVTSLVAGVLLILVAVKPPRSYSSGPVPDDTAKQWATIAETLHGHEVNQLTLTTLLAIELYHHQPLPENETFLREHVVLLARKQPLLSQSIYGTQHRFSPNGQWLATVSQNQLYVWQTNNGQVGQPITLPHPTQITAFAFSHQNSWLVTSGLDQMIRFWDVVTGQELYQLSVGQPVESLTLSPDNRWLFVSSRDRPAQLWEISGTRVDSQLTLYPSNCWPALGRVKSAAFSPDGQWLATSYGTSAQVWQLNSGQMIASLWQPAEVSHLAFSPDSQLFVTADLNTAQVWQLQAEKIAHQDQVIKKVANFDHPFINATLFSPDSRQLAINSQHQAIIHPVDLTSAFNGTQPLTLTHSAQINTIAYSPDGQWLATASEDKTARIWDAATGEELKRLPHNTAVRQLAFHPTDWQLTTINRNQMVQRWQPMEFLGQPISHYNGTPQIVIQMPNQDMRYLTPNQAGQVLEFILTTNRADNLLRIWIATPSQMGQITPINDVVMIPLEVNGLSNLMVQGWDNRALLNEQTTIDQLLEVACRHLERNLSREEWQTHIQELPYRVTCGNLPAGV